MEAHIPSFSPDTIASIGSFHITNTMINVWLALIIFFVFGMVLRKKVHVRPSRLQNSCEYFLESLFHYLDQVTGSRESTIKFFPVVGTVFFFILLSNWLGLLPGTGSITVDHAPLFRPANTDLNLTVAMALVSVISSHIFAFATIGFFSHANKFVQLGTIVKSLKKGPVAIFQALVEFMVGIIEIVDYH